MRENGLKARQRRRFRKTTDSDHGGPVAAAQGHPNILDQDFSCDGPDQKWGVDISYIWANEGWLYLTIVVGFYSRRIVGWATSSRMKRNLALNALRRATALRNPPAGLIHRSDRGSQYCFDDYRRELRKYRLIASMSGKGNCYDNPRCTGPCPKSSLRPPRRNSSRLRTQSCPPYDGSCEESCRE